MRGRLLPSEIDGVARSTFGEAKLRADLLHDLRNSRSWPDRLSGWTLPPPMARAAGEVQPVRVFDTAEAALAFLAEIYLSVAVSRNSTSIGAGRRLRAKATA